MAINVDARKSAGKATLTKHGFAKRIQPRVTQELGPVTVDEAQALFEIVLDEIRELIREGYRLQVNDFGMFYGKKMKKRRVKGGIIPESFDNAFVVPAKTKIGFSSTPSGDKIVSRRKRTRVKKVTGDRPEQLVIAGGDLSQKINSSSE